MKRCPTCNRSYADSLSFCLQCGTHLGPDFDPEATVVGQPQPRASSNHRVYQIIIVLLVLILAGAGIGLYIALSAYNARTQVAATSSPEPSRTDPLSLLNANAPAKSSPTPAATASPTNPDQPAIPKIYGRPYDVARRVLIKGGWLPNKRLPIHGESVDVQSGNGPIFWQRGYWELESCSGTGSAFCLFEFTNPTGRLLEVVTEGEEDEAGTYHAIVSRVYLKKK